MLHVGQGVGCVQESVDQVGTVYPPIEGTSPASVPGETEVTQALYGSLDDATYLTRGYDTSVPNMNMANTNNDTQVQVGTPGGALPSSPSSPSSSPSSPAKSSPSSSPASSSSPSPSSSSGLTLSCA